MHRGRKSGAVRPLFNRDFSTQAAEQLYSRVWLRFRQTTVATGHQIFSGLGPPCGGV